MNHGKICVSVCATTAGEMLDRLDQAIPLADVVELRFDCLSPEQIDKVLENLPKANKPYIVTYRPASQGGHSAAGFAERTAFWSRVMDKLRDHDFMIDHEEDLDLPLKLGPERTIVSFHDFDGRVSDLPSKFASLSRFDATTIKVAVTADDSSDAIPVWRLLDEAGSAKRRVIPIGMGEGGKWTRILGLAHGAPLTYASLDADSPTAPGQISASDLEDVFRVKDLDQETRVYGVLAGDTSYSLSPVMHNTAFKAAGMNSIFVPFQVRDVARFLRRMIRRESREVSFNICGLSVTNPHKQTIIPQLDEVDGIARRIGAVNTVKVEDDKLYGFNTDADGLIAPLKRIAGDISGACAVVVGTGGAARACVFALASAGADVVVLARDVEKARRLADEFAVRWQPLKPGISDVAADILVNATPIGTRGEHEEQTMFTADELRDVKLVYDLVYNPLETRLLREAKSAGAQTLGGLDMLVAQGVRQFEIWTGETPAAEMMRRVVGERLG